MHNRIMMSIGMLLLPLSLLAENFCLDGRWDVALSEEAPSVYVSECPVPGIASQSVPELAADLHHFDSEVNYSCVWYRKVFDLDTDAPLAFLMLRAKYTAEVWLNGVRVGFSDACTYSHSRFDLTSALNRHGRNELVVRVGSWNEASFPSKENKSEFWRTSRCPGIIDNAWIELTPYVYSDRLEVLPDVAASNVVIRGTLHNAGRKNSKVVPVLTVRDQSGSALIRYTCCKTAIRKGQDFDFTVKADASKLQKWTPGPEGNPVLYTVDLSVDGKSLKTVRFGYRDVKVSGKDVLVNGEKTHFAAENIAFTRTLISWADCVLNPQWVRAFLREAIHSYDFNFLRMHLGHAPSLWYDIADEEGMMIQDEWAFMHEKDPQGENLAQTGKEFTAWVKENINHPSIIGWDMENEGDVDLFELSAKLRAYDPTRMWSEDDFDTQHRYEYSENIVPRPYCQPSETKPTTVLESCRLWVNQYGRLEPRESFKTSRTASSWGVYYYTTDIIEQLQADIHADQGTYFRSVEVQAWAPFALLSGTVNGHNFFRGNLADSLSAQKNLLVLKAFNQKVGASISMLQAREWYKDRISYEASSTFSKPVVLWNDKGNDVEAEVTVSLEGEGAIPLSSVSFRTLIPAHKAVTMENAFELPLPSMAGEYTVRIQVVAEGVRYDGPSRRVAVDCRPQDLSLPFDGSVCLLDHFLEGMSDDLKARIITLTKYKPLDSISKGGRVVKYTVYDQDSSKSYKMTLDEQGSVLSDELLKNKSTGWLKHAF